MTACIYNIVTLKDSLGASFHFGLPPAAVTESDILEKEKENIRQIISEIIISSKINR